MAKQQCPECPDEGLPGWMGTFADMMTLLFAFFVLMFSLATMDPAKLDALGGDKAGAGEAKEAVEEIIEEIQELKEAGVTEIQGMPIEEYKDSLVEANMPPPKFTEVREDAAEIIEEMELDSSQANLAMRDQRGIAFELNGEVCFKSGEAIMEPKLIEFLDAAVDSFLANPNDSRQIVVEGHTDNIKPDRKTAKKYPTNWELSSARASAVVTYLIDKGVNPARLVAHGYADRWPADLNWEDMRRGFVFDSDEAQVGREAKEKPKIFIDSLIDSLNSTRELRAKNRRIKIIFTHNNYVDGNDPWRPPAP